MQRAAELCRSHSSPEVWVGGRGGITPDASTHGGLDAPAESTLGKVLGGMQIAIATKGQVLQSIAGAFQCNAVLHKWRIVPSLAYTLCDHLAETQRATSNACALL